METDATRTCALLVGLPDVVVLGVGDWPLWLRVTVTRDSERPTCSCGGAVHDDPSLAERRILVRSDSAGASHWLAEECVDRNIEFTGVMPAAPLGRELVERVGEQHDMIDSGVRTGVARPQDAGEDSSVSTHIASNG